MTEVFLINYKHNESDEWTCFQATHSLYVSTEKARELRDLGYRVNVQSVLLNEYGRVVL